MKTVHAFFVLLFSFQGLALPQLGHHLHQNFADEKVYPYCNNPDDPSISCDERDPETGNYIDGNRPNPNATCSNIFFMCTNGVSKCFNCQDIDGIRLYYDHPQLKCDYKEKVVGCIGEPDSTTTSLSTSTTPITPTPTTVSTTTSGPTVPPDYVCPEDNGFFPIDPSKCLPNYYVCVNGAPSIGTCPPGSLFDPATLYCVPEDQASCNFQCPVANGFFPVYGHDTDQCFNGYITCVAFIAYPQRCPPKSVFDPEDGYCVPGSSNGCAEESTTPGIPVTLPPVDPNNLCCPGVGQYPLSGSCTQYVVCANDLEPTITSCRVGQVFNPYLGVCDDPANVPGCNKYSIVDYIRGLRNIGKQSSRAQC